MTEFKVTKLGQQGDGVVDGPIYAAMTLPGEVITGDVKGDRILSPKIAEPSSDRVTPPCKHFKRCGGCIVQHAKDSFVEKWKVQMMHDALSMQGLPAPIRNVHTSPPNSRRRAGFSGKRTKTGAIVGFHSRGSDVVVEVPECRLVVPELINLHAAMIELTKLGASRKSTVTMMTAWSVNGADIAMEGAIPLEPNQIPNAVEIATRHKLSRLTWNGEVVVEIQPATQYFGGVAVAPPPGAFLQATKEGEEALFSAVTETVGTAKSVVDLFAGCGTFSLPLLLGSDVHAVESDSAMLHAMDKGWRHASNLRRLTTEVRDLFRRPLLPIELNKFNAAVIDPPRAGAVAQTTEIAASEIATVAFVSCNPSTFARDAKILVDAGFKLNWIDVIDQFRWSPHIELAASFTR